MKPERKFYEKIKKSIPEISWIRLENNSLFGTPDLLAYNTSGHFFTVELKVRDLEKSNGELRKELKNVREALARVSGPVH